MSHKRENLLTLAAQALEFSAHAVQRRGILPLPDQLSKDAAEAIAKLAIETQVDHLRRLGYTNVAALFDPDHFKPLHPEMDNPECLAAADQRSFVGSSPRQSNSTKKCPPTPPSE